MATQVEIALPFMETQTPTATTDSAMSIDSPRDTVIDADAVLEAQLFAAATAGDLDLIISVLTPSSQSHKLLTQIAAKAAKAKHTSILSWCLTSPAFIPLPESVNDGLFGAACESGSIPVFKVLLDQGFDLNRHYSEHLGDALGFACMRGNLDLVKFLLENKHAVNSGLRCLERLAVVWAVTCEGFSQDVGLEILKLLMKHGAKIEGVGAAIAAAERDNLPALIMLLDAGAGMEEDCSWWGASEKMGDEEEGTALFRACAKGKGRTVEYLIGRGANKDTEGSEGSSCYDVAEGKRYIDVLRMLQTLDVTVEWPD